MKITTGNVKVRVKLKKGKTFVTKVMNDVSDRTNTMVGKLKMVDGKYHLKRSCKGYYIVNPRDIEDVKVV